MRAKDIAKYIEEYAPLNLQESYDNAGFTVGDPEREVRGVLLAVDVTSEVIEEALGLGVDMIITHHPLIFNPIKRLNSSNYVERCVEQAIKNDIILYAAHTNLDSTVGGMSWRLGEILGVENMQVLLPTTSGADIGYGVVGELAREWDTVEYMSWVGKMLDCKAIRHSDMVSERCRRVAICTGSGGSMMSAARESGADVYITSDLRYNDFMTPSGGFTVVDVGHYESEYCAIHILFDILSKKITNFALHKSRNTRNPINYLSLR